MSDSQGFAWGRLMQRLLSHLPARRRRQLLLLGLLMMLSTVAEVLSLGAVVPFLAVLAAPETLFGYAGVARLAGAFGWTQPAQLAAPLTVAFASATAAAAGLRLLLMWANSRVGFAAGADLSIEVYRRTLYQPYQVHVRRNSSEVISGILSKVDTAVYGAILTSLSLASAALLIVAVLVVLLLADPLIALGVAGAFGGAYGAIAWRTRRKLAEASRQIASEQVRIMQSLQEGLGAIRDVLLDGTQPVYCEAYRKADLPLRRAQASISFVSHSPRYVMEAFGILLVALLAFGLSRGPGGLAPALPVLGALALGAQRLLPAIQQSYQAWASLRSSGAAMADLLALLEQPLPPEASGPPPPPAPLQHTLELRDLCFRYGEDTPWVLQNLSLQIRKGQRVGLVGSTGSGKSTLVDLLMGLLPPTSGAVLADGRPIEGTHVRAWQQTLAHVPQSIFLADASVTANIALGVPPQEVDMDLVREAARQAQLAEFIESRPQGYDTVVGERGIRLSGGQRQRIGIARALYKRANVLLFDEATSALDTATEQSIMSTIDSLSRDLTIVMIAHRLTTVRDCDTILELQAGRLVAAGTFEELLRDSPSFRRMARVS